MKFVKNDVLQQTRILDILLPEGSILSSHDAIVKHLEVRQDDIRRVRHDLAGILDDPVLGHDLAEVLLVETFSDKEPGSDLSPKPFISINSLGESLGLVSGQSVHRVEDDDLDSFLPYMPVTVVQDGEEETLCLTGAGPCGDKGVMRHMAILSGQLVERLDLMLVGRESRLDLEWDPETIGCGDKGALEGDIRPLDHTVTGIFKKLVESLPDRFFLEPVGGPDELEDGFLYFVCLLER